MSLISCSTCRFWRQYIEAETSPPTDTARGHCHRNAPMPIAYDEFEVEHENGDSPPNDILWPSTESVDWCGEYESTIQQSEIDPQDRIELLGLPSRVKNVLRSDGVRSITSLLSRTVDDLLELRGIGETYVCKLQVALQEHRGLQLKRRR